MTWRPLPNSTNAHCRIQPGGFLRHGCGTRERSNQAELEIQHADNSSCDLINFPRSPILYRPLPATATPPLCTICHDPLWQPPLAPQPQQWPSPPPSPPSLPPPWMRMMHRQLPSPSPPLLQTKPNDVTHPRFAEVWWQCAWVVLPPWLVTLTTPSQHNHTSHRYVSFFSLTIFYC